MKTAHYALNPIRFILGIDGVLHFEEVQITHIDSQRKQSRIVLRGFARHVGWIWLFESEKDGQDEIGVLKCKYENRIKGNVI